MSVINHSGVIGAGNTDASIPDGGAEGQILVKNTSADYDVSWSSYKPAIVIEPDDNVGGE